MYIAVLNAGSSSLKIQIFRKKGSLLKPYLKGIADAIGLKTAYLEIDGNETSFGKKIPLKNHEEALQQLLQFLLEKKFLNNLEELQLIGHRVVHGGEKYTKATLITPKVIKDIEELCQLAPLHNPPALKCILYCQEILPKIRQTVVFDTAFHQTLPPVAYLYALPLDLYHKHKIRRYGFHGINNKYVVQEATKILRHEQHSANRLIVCHLGNGCSITAIKNQRSIDTSMGFTPLEGLVMGTRSGDLDPAIPLELSKKLHLSPPELEQYLNKKSGILGLTEISSDLRPVYRAFQDGDSKAIFALELFCYRLGKYLNSYIGVLGGIDAIIFTGGIGEHYPLIRRLSINYLRHLGLKLNSSANLHNHTILSSSSSQGKILMIPANEELEIAQQSLKLHK